MGEHRPYKPRVTGSSPVPPTIKNGGVAQLWLERRPVKPEVASSSLVTPAINNIKGLEKYLSPFYLAKNVIPHTIPHKPDENQGKNIKIMPHKKPGLRKVEASFFGL